MSRIPPSEYQLKPTIHLMKMATGGNERMRRRREAPVFKRLGALYQSTRVGKISRRISDYSHVRWFELCEHIVYKLSLFRIRRRIAFLMCSFGAFAFGYVHAGFGNNFYTLGYR